MKIKAKIYEDNSYDGNCTMIEWEENGEKKEDMLYTDNPIVYGFPDKTVAVCGKEFNTMELMGCEEGEIELDLDTGEITCPN